MIYEIAAQAGLGFCNPFTSASCIVKTVAGTVAGGVLGPAGAVAGGIAGNSGAAGAVVKSVGGAVADTAVNGLASAIGGALTTIVKDTVAWWINIPSPDVATDPVPKLIQSWLFPFTSAVALLGFITIGIRMAVTRKAAPLADLGSGLLTMAATTAVATVLPSLLLKAGDSFSSYVLTASTGGHFAQRLTALIALGAVTNPQGSAGLAIVLGIFAIIMATIQAILLLFRMGAVIILAGTLPLAAAGQLTPLTRPWLKRQAGWLLALIFYKPAAALVYATGFALFGSGNSPEDLLMGFAVLGLSLIALPALMKFFTWTTGQMESGGGGMLSAVIGGAAAIGAVRGYGGMSAAGQAQSLAGSLGQAGTGPSGTAGTGQGGGQGGNPSGAGQSPSGGGNPQGPGTAGSGTTAPGGAGGTRAGQPSGGGTGAPSGGTTAAGAPGAVTAGGTTAGGATAAGGGAGAAAGAAGPAGVVVLGAQAAQVGVSAARGVAGSVAPPDGAQS